MKNSFFVEVDQRREMETEKELICEPAELSNASRM